MKFVRLPEPVSGLGSKEISGLANSLAQSKGLVPEPKSESLFSIASMRLLTTQIPYEPTSSAVRATSTRLTPIVILIEKNLPLSTLIIRHPKLHRLPYRLSAASTPLSRLSPARAVAVSSV